MFEVFRVYASILMCFCKKKHPSIVATIYSAMLLCRGVLGRYFLLSRPNLFQILRPLGKAFRTHFDIRVGVGKFLGKISEKTSLLRTSVFGQCYKKINKPTYTLSGSECLQRVRHSTPRALFASNILDGFPQIFFIFKIVEKTALRNSGGFTNLVHRCRGKTFPTSALACAK